MKDLRISVLDTDRFAKLANKIIRVYDDFISSNRSEARSAIDLTARALAPTPTGEMDRRTSKIITHEYRIDRKGLRSELRSQVDLIINENLIQTENRINGYLSALEPKERIVLDVIVSDSDLILWGTQAEGIIQKILETARHLNAKSHGQIMTRLKILAKDTTVDIKRPKDTLKSDSVSIQIENKLAIVSNPALPQSKLINSIPATITITSSEMEAETLLRGVAAGQGLPYLEAVEAELIGAVIGITGTPLQKAELLKNVGESKGFVQRQIKNSGVAAMLNAVAQRLAEQFRSELRVKQAA